MYRLNEKKARLLESTPFFKKKVTCLTVANRGWGTIFFL